MKFNRSTLAVLSTLMILTGCNGGGSSSGKGTQQVSFKLEDGSIDTLVFERSGEVVAKNNLLKNLSNFFIQSAYAAVNKQIECEVPELVTFDMEILGAPVQISTKCSSNLEKQVRAGMLESMAGETVIFEYSGGSDQLQEGRMITFRNSGQAGTGVDVGETGFFGKYNDIYANVSNDYCRETFDFDEKEGTVTISLDVANTKARANAAGYPILGQDQDEDGNEETLSNADEVVANCVFFDGGLSNYTMKLNFRFKNGFLEFDPDGTDYSDNLTDSDMTSYEKLLDYVRGCVKSSGSDTCDVSRLPNGSYQSLPEVCHPIDYANNNCHPSAKIPWNN